MQTVIRGLERLRRLAQQLGPYLMLEILLPGGTLFALLLFLARRWTAPRRAPSGERMPKASSEGSHRRATLVPAWVPVPSWRPRWTGSTWWPEWLFDPAIPMSNSGSPNRL